MFDLRDNWKDVTASIEKRGKGASWQLTDKAEVLATVSEAVQLVKSQPA